MTRMDSMFLKEARKRLDFPHRWVDWIIECVTTMRNKVKLQAARVKQILDSYATRTEQLLNPQTCSIYFGESCPSRVRQKFKVSCR
jgi:hypothetical protein